MIQKLRSISFGRRTRRPGTLSGILAAMGLLLAAGAPAPAAPEEAAPPATHRLTGHLEMGYLGVLSHRVKFSNDGTYIDYRSDGGQDNIYAITRMSLDLALSKRSTLIFLYQPLRLETQNIPSRDLRIDGLVFPAGTPMKFVYSFPFWRVSYLYNLSKDPKTELAVGGSFQIRNASIEFASLDGTLFRSNRNVGPVPILKFRGRKLYDNGFWIGAEADGFYAPVSYINGSDNEVIGAILDASVRAGVLLPRNAEAFVNLRYLGGGAVGTSKDKNDLGDGYVKNWLHFMTVSVGLSLKLH